MAADGAQFAVTGLDPQRPSQFSRNVFVLTPATGGMQQVTFFEDKVSSNAHNYVTGYYKAFSPDRSFVAVNSYYVAGNANPRASPDPTGSQITPILEIYRADGELPAKELVHADSNRDGVHHGGEGVDWSTTQNILAAPLKWGCPAPDGSTGECTAVILMDPVGGAIENGRFRQLTHPAANEGEDPFGGSSFVSTEHDYYPRFSPNGAQVAYVRSFQRVSSANNYQPEFYVESLRIANTGGSADNDVLDFPQGLYVSSLCWSPDGTEIAFDVGQQASSNGFPAPIAQPGTVEMYIINLGSGQVRKLHDKPSGTPAWAPAGIPKVTPTPGSSATPTPGTTATPTPGTTATPTPSGTATPGPAGSGTLANISTRLRVLKGENVLIGGFIITGNQPKKVLLRAIASSLASAGVNGALQDPVLELHQGSNLIATNDNWKDKQQSEIQATNIPPSDDRESAIVATLNPGSYTAILRGNSDGTGIALVEVYDLSGGADSTVANISTRGFVDTDENAMIGGFIVGNNSSANVILRAIGPSLGSSGVQGALPDTTLELHDGNGTQIAFNDDWQSDANASQVQAAGIAPQDPHESAIATNLAGGNYTVVVRGKNNSTGVGLVEVYHVQ